MRGWQRGLIAGIVLTMIICSAGCITGDTKKTYVVGIDMSNLPPYSYHDEHGNIVGFDVESVKWIAEEEGFSITFKPVSWETIIPSLLAGKIDLIYSGMTITEDRQKQVTFSNPYWKANQAIAIKKGTNWTYDDFMSGTMSVGIQRGVTTLDWIKENIPSYAQMSATGKIKEFDSLAQALDAVSAGTIDCAMQDDLNILSYLKASDNLELMTTIDTGERYGVAMRNEDAVLQEKINNGLSKLMNSTKWNELIEKYIAA